MMLEAGDIVFVPVAGPLVGIAGNVKRPAIYELKGVQDLNTAFSLAGGIVPTAYTQQIQVERIVKNEKQIVVDINDKDLKRTRDITLHDGDLVKVFSIVDKDVNALFLEGNVKRPGKYEYKDGMRVKDLIKGPTDLLQETHFEYATIKRRMPPDMNQEIITFNLGKLLFQNDAMQNLELKPSDTVTVYSQWSFKDRPVVTVSGEVRNPDKFELVKKTTVKDAILLAGGLTPNAYLQKADILRRSKQREWIRLYINVDRALKDDPAHNLELQNDDTINIHSIRETTYQKTVFVEGEVLKPGSYPYTEDMTVKDLVFASGNVLESAYLANAEVSSQITDENGSDVKLVHRTISLKKALQGDPENNIVLKPYDRLFVKRMAGWRKERYATISGEIEYPGRYILKDGETLSNLIERAGGYKEQAYLRGAVFTRASVQQLQQKNIEEMANRLQRQLLAESSTTTTSVTTPGEAQARKTELEQRQAFIDSLKTVKATGRMTVSLAHQRLLKGSLYDIPLEDGDSLYIPMNNRVVNVMGAVMTNASLVYSENTRPTDYIQMAGGYSQYADTKNTYVLKVDGSAKKLSGGFLNWNGSKERWELNAPGAEPKQIESGDTIVVPEKLERIAWLREFKDITQILAQLATATGVIYLMTK
jgi:protein involved in polysaccharide export with SLBB domain